MHVAMIIHGYAPKIGGAERLLGTIAPLVQSQGIKVCILTRRLPGTAAFELIDGVPVYRLPAPGIKPVASLVFTLTAIPLLIKLHPDIIHAHELISPATTALFAHYLTKIPLVLTPHLSGTKGDVQRMAHKAFGKLRLSLFNRQAAAFVAISKEIDAELGAAGVPPQKRVFITNGIDIQHFKPLPYREKLELRKTFGISSEARVLVFVGRLVQQKRLDLLLSAWPEIRRSCPEAELLIIGDGPLENDLKQAATEGVRFCGKQLDVAPYLQIADIFVLPSDAEGLPVALLEALACELACAATAIGGIPDVITQGENGLLVSPGDPVALRQAIQTLARDASLRDKLGKNGRNSIIQNYTVVKMVSRLINLYRIVLGDRETL